MISVRGFLYFIGQLRPRFFAKAQRAQERRIDRANAVELRLLFEDLLQNFRGLNRFAVIVERAGAKSFFTRNRLRSSLLLSSGPALATPPMPICWKAKSKMTGCD